MSHEVIAPHFMGPSATELLGSPALVAEWQDQYGQELASWYAQQLTTRSTMLAATCLVNPAAYMHEPAMTRLPEAQRRRWVDILADAGIVVTIATLPNATEQHTWYDDETNLDKLLRIVSANMIKPQERGPVAELMARASRQFGQSYMEAPGRDDRFYAGNVNAMAKTQQKIVAGHL